MNNKSDYETQYRNFVKNYLKRDLSFADGISEDQISSVEQNLGFQLPNSLRIYYKIVGRCDELNNYQNRLISLEKIFCEEEFLVFLEENQNIVYWGVKTKDLQDDPTVWQIQNTEPIESFSEEKSFTKFMPEMFNWQFGTEI